MWVIRERKAYPLTHVSDFQIWITEWLSPLQWRLEEEQQVTSKEKNTLHFRDIDYEVPTGYPSEDSSRLLEILIWNSGERHVCTGVHH